MAPFTDHRVFFLAMNQNVSNVIEVNLMPIHVSKAEEERGIRSHDLEEDGAEGGLDANGADRHDIRVITKSNAMLASC